VNGNPRLTHVVLSPLTARRSMLRSYAGSE
jgi:hypothetical protein